MNTLAPINHEAMLAHLREHLDLPEQIPTVGEIHPIADVIDGTRTHQVMLCCHVLQGDEDAGHSYQLAYPAAMVPNPMDIPPAVRTHIERVVAAGWN